MIWNMEKFISKLNKLNVDHNNNRYTLGKAPHKPVLLLSLALLYKNEKVDLDNIKPDLYLRDTWESLWECLDYKKVGPIHLPMYHMRSDGFWEIDLKEGMSPHQPRSLNELVDMSSRIHLRQEIIQYFGTEEERNEIMNTILNGGYFSDPEIKRLRQYISNFDSFFEYEEKLNTILKQEFRMNLDQDDMMESRRDPAFRRMVLEAYDERCSVCELKLVTSSGISVIDSAHILPLLTFQER